MTPEQIYFELIPAVRAMISGDYPNITNFTYKDSLKFFPESVNDHQEWKKNHEKIISFYIEETGDIAQILNEIRIFSQTLTVAQKSMPVWIYLKSYGLIHSLGLPDLSLKDDDGQVFGKTWDRLLGRLAFKVVMVTGGAQGFGAGIAASAFEQGAHVVIADMNRKKAEELVEKYNAGNHPNRMIFVQADISNSESVKDLMLETVKAFGGLDVMISNAGVLRAGGLDELSEADFDFVTKVNYKGFYLCTKYASKLMKAQNKEQEAWFSDIIQVNSKSGLQGSNRNFAYAGSKFGGLGLVQSFALELVEDKIKVNAVCPGNFFDGPLWSDPENGLFVQYLRAGKVEGAKTLEDVRSFYESKVPMKRGVTVDDVMTAIYYAIEQKYETGQAIPVTGGQVMR
ncbi:MAG: SDR family NAD(P)-dependent oxidoreductase [Bacteroidales bacterium]|nr:SDR family NAD(P)-dependent oxidoreductase [Bacteroidales bacterium]